MWRSKKLVIVAVVAAVVLTGSIAGAAVLAADSGNATQPGTPLGALWDRVGAIYKDKTGVTIDQQGLKDAITQAQKEMRTEALKNRLQDLVTQGKITQEQADQYLKWEQSRPDVPFGFGFRGPGGFRGMGGMHGFGGPCAPAP